MAKSLSAPKSNYINLNLDKLNNVKGNKIIVIGNVLGQGEINKKIDISAIKFSKRAIEKLNRANCNIIKIKEQITKNKKLDGVEIIC